MTPSMHITAMYHMTQVLCRRACRTRINALQVVLLGQQSVGEFRALCNGFHCKRLLGVAVIKHVGICLQGKPVLSTAISIAPSRLLPRTPSVLHLQPRRSAAEMRSHLQCTLFSSHMYSCCTALAFGVLLLQQEK